MEYVGQTTKYEQLASRLQRLIEDRVYEPGERLPSIRAIHRETGASINTVREAYRVLENRGVAEAVPQSGYFVLQGPPICAGSDMGVEESAWDGVPREIAPDEFTRRVLEEASKEHVTDVSQLLPPAEVLPVSQLGDSMHRVLRSRAFRTITYDIPYGPPVLRQEIAKRLFRGGLSRTPEDVVVTAGCLEAVFLSLATVCRPGDAVMVESPGFYLFYRLLARLGLRAIEVPSRCCDGIDVEIVRAILKRRSTGTARIRAALVLGNFTNPIGALMPDDAKRELASVLSHHGVYLIEDDMYGELYFGRQRPASIAAYADPDRTMLCASFSKTLAPGYRIGWVTALGELRDQVHHTKLVTSITTSGPAAHAIADFLERGSYDRVLRRAREHYRTNLRRLREAVYRYFPGGTTATVPEGGMVLWVALPRDIDVIELFNRARARGIVFFPGTMFSIGDAYRNCMRLSATRWDAQVQSALQTLGQLARQ